LLRAVGEKDDILVLKLERVMIDGVGEGGIGSAMMGKGEKDVDGTICIHSSPAFIPFQVSKYFGIS